MHVRSRDEKVTKSEVGVFASCSSIFLSNDISMIISKIRYEMCIFYLVLKNVSNTWNPAKMLLYFIKYYGPLFVLMHGVIGVSQAMDSRRARETRRPPSRWDAIFALDPKSAEEQQQRKANQWPNSLGVFSLASKSSPKPKFVDIIAFEWMRKRWTEIFWLRRNNILFEGENFLIAGILQNIVWIIHIVENLLQLKNDLRQFHVDIEFALKISPLPQMSNVDIDLNFW